MTEKAATFDNPYSPADGSPLEREAPAKPRAVRLWPGCVLIAIYWATVLIAGLVEMPISTSFMTTAGVGALVVLVFTIWWLTNGTIRGRDRLAVFAAVVLGAVAASVLSNKTLGIGGVLFFGLPWAYTVWIVWSVFARRFLPAYLSSGAIVATGLVWAYVSLIRMNGISGDLKADVQWRWESSTEEQYLAERQKGIEQAPALKPDDGGESSNELAAVEGDWTAFRGPLRNGEVRGLEIATDWNTSPPKQVWRQRIGPAWSSMLIVGGLLFTQEQIGDEEAVVAFDAATGKRIWTHFDKTRFWDGQSGAGPRGTPEFIDGVIFTQGATGILNCLDAATGRVKWSRDIAKDSGAGLPPWGFSCSPLVVDDVVITYAGGKDDRGLLAYHKSDGKPAWQAATGSVSYTSPVPIDLEGEKQVLFLSDLGLIAVSPASGKLAWHYEANGHGVWRATQPVQLGPSQVLLASEDLGTVCLDIEREAGGWKATQRWASKAMKAAYNDFVLYGGCAYGFDGGIFGAIDLKTGKRRWKGGRYGHGQVLLLSDQGLLIVSSESGEAVLVSATPDKHHELARFQAIEGKTWNHPVIAHACLYMRNDQEIACYQLPQAGR
jgi:outer membrane protein assembly factor BamB